MELWIPITIAAAFCQNIRSALQKHVRGALSTTGATYVRFCYAAPLAIVYVLALILGGHALPAANPEFVLYVLTGGVTQIVGTALLVGLFSLRNFAVGTTYSKTETVQTAIFGIVILGEPVGSAALGAIVVSLAGVLAISAAAGGVTARSLVRGLVQKPALIGLASGAFFGMSAVAYRAAALSLGDESVLIRAAFTLACATTFQTVVMSVYLRWREPGEITRAIRAWRVAGLVGVAGMLASVGWFTAMTIQNAAYVRALGQIELVFTFIASHVFFGERSNATEVVGILLVIAGILLLVLV